jgi:hypothetical protein
MGGRLVRHALPTGIVVRTLAWLRWVQSYCRYQPWLCVQQTRLSTYKIQLGVASRRLLGLCCASWQRALYIPFQLTATVVCRYAGAVAVYLAWMNLLIYVRRFGSVGIYVLMMTYTLATASKVRWSANIAVVLARLCAGTFVVVQCKCLPIDRCGWQRLWGCSAMLA